MVARALAKHGTARSLALSGRAADTVALSYAISQRLHQFSGTLPV